MHRATLEILGSTYAILGDLKIYQEFASGSIATSTYQCVMGDVPSHAEPLHAYDSRTGELTPLRQFFGLPKEHSRIRHVHRLDAFVGNMPTSQKTVRTFKAIPSDHPRVTLEEMTRLVQKHVAIKMQGAFGLLFAVRHELFPLFATGIPTLLPQPLVQELWAASQAYDDIKNTWQELFVLWQHPGKQYTFNDFVELHGWTEDVILALLGLE